MELLIIKCGQKYIRFKDGEYLIVNLDKASVFPLDQLPEVQKHLLCLKSNKFDQVQIKKLLLTEEDF